MNCSSCCSNNVEKRISWGRTGNIVTFGLKYDTFLVDKVADVYTDLCNDCGNIIDMYLDNYTQKVI